VAFIRADRELIVDGDIGLMRVLQEVFASREEASWQQIGG
jgi:hypothetical protein